MAKEQELEKQESDRRMLAEQTANVEARAALEREKSAQESARARYKRQESFSDNLKEYIQHSAKKKKRVEQEDAKPQAIVIQPSPLRPSPNKINYETRGTRSAAKPPVSAKKVKRPAKKTPAKKKPQVDIDIDFTDKKDILEKTTVEVVWSLDHMDFGKLVQSAWELGMLQDCTKPRKRNKLGGDIVRAFCERLNKEEMHAELNYEELDDAEVAETLHDWLGELANGE